MFEHDLFPKTGTHPGSQARSRASSDALCPRAGFSGSCFRGHRSSTLFRPLLAAAILLAHAPAVAAAAEINIAYLRSAAPRPTLSLVQTPAANDGLAGAQLAIDDNNTTGKFLDQQFSLA